MENRGGYMEILRGRRTGGLFSMDSFTQRLASAEGLIEHADDNTKKLALAVILDGLVEDVRYQQMSFDVMWRVFTLVNRLVGTAHGTSQVHTVYEALASRLSGAEVQASWNYISNFIDGHSRASPMNLVVRHTGLHPWGLPVPGFMPDYGSDGIVEDWVSDANMDSIIAAIRDEAEERRTEPPISDSAVARMNLGDFAPPHAPRESHTSVTGEACVVCQDKRKRAKTDTCKCMILCVACARGAVARWMRDKHRDTSVVMTCPGCRSVVNKYIDTRPARTPRASESKKKSTSA